MDIYTTASEARFPSPISLKEYDIAGSTPESLRQLSHIHGDFITNEVEPVPPLPPDPGLQTGEVQDPGPVYT